MQLIGHRGAAGEAPENTLAGFAYARELGLGAVELDVCLAKDGPLVVIHDDTVDRTTSASGPVADFTSAELGALGVPSLAEVLTQFPGFHYQIEIKRHAPERYEAVCRQIADLVQAAGLAEQVLVISFDPLALEAMCRVAPDLPRGLLGGYADLTDVDTAVGLQCAWISAYIGSCTEAAAQAARERGMRVCVWTCNTEEDWRRALALEADALVSDVPSLVRQSGLFELS